MPQNTASQMGMEDKDSLPGAGLASQKMPGHWLLARLGKKVLRPGGLELTNFMMKELDVTSEDEIVEFAPGMGATAEIALAKKPRSYTAVDRDSKAVERLCKKFKDANCTFQQGTAEKNGLPDGIATVVYGEAMLTMQVNNKKEMIVREAARLLKPGGRYGIHELSLLPDNLNDEDVTKLCSQLGSTIHVGARPLLVPEWRALLEDAGFEIVAEQRAAMDLLEPARLIADEGVEGAMRVIWNALHDEEALARVREMRTMFRKNKDNLGAISLVARKK